VPVPEKRLPFFKVGKELKELVNGGVPDDGVTGPGA
jgi:nucleoid DNA-binding protein